MSKRKIGIVTGTRAEYGLLYWIIREVAQDPELELQLFVTGMHLSPEFGLTIREINRDGLLITEKVESLVSSDTPVGVAKSIGLGIIGFADAFARSRPDILVVLGDRYEILAACQAALVARIPIAHVHGGEVTCGAIDEAIRHSITKMSLVHFVAAETYRRRVIQLGEHPDRVFNVGAPGIEHIRRTDLMPRAEFEESIGMSLGKTSFLVTFHPETLADNSPSYAIEEILRALDCFPEACIIFTGSNSDPGGHAINQSIRSYVDSDPTRMCFEDSLGPTRYISALHLVDVVIGNSSSGLIEAPVARVPSVSVGTRQDGRLRASSVIDCDLQRDAIVDAIKNALDPSFVRKARDINDLPYGDGKTASAVAEILKGFALDKNVLIKTFYDLK